MWRVEQKSNKPSKPKTVLRLPDLELSKNAVLNSLPAELYKSTDMPSMSSSSGIAQSHVWLSTAQLHSATGFSSNRGSSPLHPPSTCVS